VESLIERECESFPEWEKSLETGIEAVSKAARNLAFLEKWRAGLRGCYARLV
jgi:hypothetical protein